VKYAIYKEDRVVFYRLRDQSKVLGSHIVLGAPDYIGPSDVSFTQEYHMQIGRS